MEMRVEALGQSPADVGAVVSPSGARCRRVRGVGEERSKTITSFRPGGQSAEPELRREFLEEGRNRSSRKPLRLSTREDAWAGLLYRP
jgi:GTP cyclohydrolase I